MKTTRMISSGAILALFATGALAGMPYEKTQFDRGLTTQPENVYAESASAGQTTSPQGGLAQGPWKDDPYFIAPSL